MARDGEIDMAREGIGGAATAAIVGDADAAPPGPWTRPATAPASKRRGPIGLLVAAGGWGLKGLGLLKLGKVGGTLLTMLVSIATYALVFGWRYAAGFVALLGIHEGGHYAAARARGLPVTTPSFIPFVGAVIAMKSAPRDAETEAFVATGGPLVGGLAAACVHAAAVATGSPLLLALAYAGWSINFLNLIPLSPLDGGRITGVISPRIWFLGAPLLVLLFVRTWNPLALVIGLAAVPALVRAWRHDPADPETARYHSAAPAVRIRYAIVYATMVAAYATASVATHRELVALLTNR